MKSKSGFTLVEILIVVVILGILAAIVIPQFTDASTQAKNNSLKADLQTLRSQIELYKIQHGDDYPVDTNSPTDTDFVTNMTTKQTYQNVEYGPYMQSVPKNCFTNRSTVIFGSGRQHSEDAGWTLDTDTGQIHPTDEAHYADPNY
jgi:general secretion pathway protein G